MGLLEDLENKYNYGAKFLDIRKEFEDLEANREDRFEMNDLDIFIRSQLLAMNTAFLYSLDQKDGFDFLPDARSVLLLFLFWEFLQLPLQILGPEPEGEEQLDKHIYRVKMIIGVRLLVAFAALFYFAKFSCCMYKVFVLSLLSSLYDFFLAIRQYKCYHERMCIRTTRRRQIEDRLSEDIRFEGGADNSKNRSIELDNICKSTGFNVGLRHSDGEA